MINEQAKHIAYIVARALEEGIESLEVSEDAEAAWVDTIIEHSERTAEFGENCTPGYYNNEGKPGEGPGWFGGNYSGGAQAFFQILRDWREDGELKGLELG